MQPKSQLVALHLPVAGCQLQVASWQLAVGIDNDDGFIDMQLAVSGSRWGHFDAATPDTIIAIVRYRMDLARA